MRYSLIPSARHRTFSIALATILAAVSPDDGRGQSLRLPDTQLVGGSGCYNLSLSASVALATLVSARSHQV